MAKEPPDPATLRIRRLLLATEGRPIPWSAVDFTADLAAPLGARVHVIAVARVWGVGFGMPNPGLLPNRREIAELRGMLADVVRRLEARGLEVNGQIDATRKATKRIVGQAESLHCDAIVMAADPPRNRFVSDLMWSQEPYRVRRRAKLPVYLVTE